LSPPYLQSPISSPVIFSNPLSIDKYKLTNYIN
jgi:hypothetical protein